MEHKCKKSDSKPIEKCELNKEQAIDILDRFDFFQGQRAGRELWNDKPFEVQEQDIAKFSRDVNLLKNYIKELTEENESAKHKYKEFESYAKQEVAKLTAENVKLTEENKVRKGLNTMLDNELRKLGEENERLRANEKSATEILNFKFAYDAGKADTVRKMQERVIAEFRKDDRMNYYIRMTLDQIAKEMVEGAE